MQRGFLLAIVLVACGSDTSSSTDAASLGVTVVSPNGGERFADSQPVSIIWVATSPDASALACDIVALSGSTHTPLATMTAPTGQQATMAWTPPQVAATTPFRIQVTVHDGTATASDTSDAEFSIAPPPPMVSFASQIQPILDGSCNASACHGHDQPPRLTAGDAYAALVGVASEECPDFDRVVPADTARSYLLFKLAGNGPCFGGERMPRGEPALDPSQIDRIRDWIMNGAPNN
jgi:hypothetical protein